MANCRRHILVWATALVIYVTLNYESEFLTEHYQELNYIFSSQKAHVPQPYLKAQPFDAIDYSTQQDNKNNEERKQPIGHDACDTCFRPLLCESWQSSCSDQVEPVKPKFKTDPGKFLLPWVYNGPNNQLYGLRQAAYIAIRLNRTLVLPLLRRHFTDETGFGAFIDAGHRFDIDALRKLIPFIPFKHYKRHCYRHADVMFLSSSLSNPWAVEQLWIAENWIDIDLFRSRSHKENREFLKKPLDEQLAVPYLPSSNKTRNFRLSASRTAIRKAFRSPARCALYVLPFKELDFPKLDKSMEPVVRNVSLDRVSNNPNKLSDWELNALVIKSTQLPVYVKELAQLYIEKVLKNGSYLAMHWRFDQKDFYQFMCKPGGNPQSQNKKINPAIAKMCKDISSIKPRELLQSLNGFMEKNVTSYFANPHNATLYIAAPATASDWLMNGFKKTKTKLRFLNSQSLVDFLAREKLEQRCEFTGRYSKDLVSLIETEICTRSAIFFRSSYSTWSDNVMLSRKLLMEENLQRFDRKIRAIMGLVDR